MKENFVKVRAGLLTALLAALLASCSTNAPKDHNDASMAFRPDETNQVTERKIIHISKGFVATFKNKGHVGKIGLLEGDYVAIYRDQSGLYYQGPGWCVYSYGEGEKKGNTMRGGLYVPTSGTQVDPAVYWNSEMGGIFAVPFGPDSLPILTKDQTKEAALATERLATASVINAGSVAGGGGAALGMGLISLFVHGTITFMPIPNSDASVIRGLMRYVTEK